MRAVAAILVVGCLVGPAVAQSARIGLPTNGPAVVIPPPPGPVAGNPIMGGTPLPPPYPGEAPPSPPPGYNVGTPVGTPVSQPLGPPQYFPPPKIITEGPPVVGAPPYRLWGNFEYLLWYSRGDQTPPLVGVLTSSGMGVLSDDKTNDGIRSGFRATAGLWLDLNRTYGIEANYMWFVRDKDYESYNDGPDRVLVRPFLDATTGNSAFIQLSNSAGTLRGFARTYTVQDVDGWEVNGLLRAPAMLSEEFHLLVGFRYFALKEQLGVEGISYAPDTQIGIAHFDEFRTRNQFYGAQIGARWNYAGEQWSAQLTGKLALGGVGQETVLRGQTMRSSPSGTTTVNGGLLNLGTNSGDYDRTKLAVMPEVSLNIGYRVTSFASLFVGYDFLYISNVQRPGRQVDQVVNPSLIPFGTAPASPIRRPMYLEGGEGYWLQGINFGVALRF